MNTKIITVMGATGAQGGGLARAILADASLERAFAGAHTEFRGARDVAESRALAPGMLDFASWLRKFGSSIPLG